MGRPKEHDARTAVALLDAAELVIAAHGLGALSVRRLAEEVGTTTRAIYSLFGSKDGLIAALGARTFDLLAAAVEALPVTDDAAADLVEAGVEGFRRLVLEHPALFRLGVLQVDATPSQLVEIGAAAAPAWAALRARMRRLQQQRGFESLDIIEASTAFHALCEGLAAIEIRGLLPPAAAEQRWRHALAALVNGLGTPACEQESLR